MKTGRRRVLQTIAAVLTGALLPRLAKKAGGLTLVDETLNERELRAVGASALTNAGAIKPDLVRQWRDGLGTQVVTAETVTAYVRWDKALLLVGLAREARLGYRTVRVDRGVFAVSLTTLG